MTDDSADDKTPKSRALKYGLPVGVVALGLVIAVVLVISRPKTEKAEARPEGLLVETFVAERERYNLSVRAHGNVVPAEEIQVHPQVAGKVFEVHPQLVPGGVVRRGDVLVQIDPADYELAVRERETQVAEARAQLALELGRRQVAQEEWELFRKQFRETATRSDLALREPQLQAAQAAVDRAEAALAQAQLQLARTQIIAPFDALVLEESVDPGQQVQPQQAIAHLAGAAEFWVRATVPPDKIPALEIPNSDVPLDARARGAMATISLDLGAEEFTYAGRVARMEGQLDPRSRLAQLLIVVDDPLGVLEPETPVLGDASQRFPLYLHAYVDVLIAGREDVEAAAIPRDAVHNGNEVYLYRDGKLAIQTVDVTWEREEDVLVEEGIEEGAQIITSNIAAPVDGMPLRLDRAGEDQAEAVASEGSASDGSANGAATVADASGDGDTNE